MGRLGRLLMLLVLVATVPLVPISAVQEAVSARASAATSAGTSAGPALNVSQADDLLNAAPRHLVGDISGVSDRVRTLQAPRGDTTEVSTTAAAVSCQGLTATIVGTAGDDELVGTAGPDVIAGRGGGDFIDGRGGNDRICGGDGDDTLLGGFGNDRISGGEGSDWAAFVNAASGITASIGAGTASGQGTDRMWSIEGLVGSEHADDLAGSSADDVLIGFGGNDLLRGADGVDFLIGGQGADDLRGGSGPLDTVLYILASGGVNASLASGTATGEGTDALSGVEALLGSDHNDVLTGSGADNLLIGMGGADDLDGRGGVDMVAFLEATAVSVNLGSGTATGEGADTLASLEGVLGTAGPDRLVGSARGELLFGDAGADVLRGAGASDILMGGSGNDTLQGDGGNDQLLGGSGADKLIGGSGSNDVADFSDSPYAIAADLAAGSASGFGADSLDGLEGLVGSAKGDRLAGDSGANLLVGAGGADVLSGRGGNDTMLGGAGNDDLTGGNGSDRLDGGEGTDVVAGNTGEDLCDAEAVTSCEGLSPTNEDVTPAPGRSGSPSPPFGQAPAPDGAAAVTSGSPSTTGGQTFSLQRSVTCQLLNNGAVQRVDAWVPAGIPVRDIWAGSDSQRVWYRSYVRQFNGVNDPIVSTSEWFYQDVSESGRTATTYEGWTRYATGQTDAWHVWKDNPNSGTYYVQSEMWWWDTVGGQWLGPERAILKDHRNADGIYRTGCLAMAPSLTTANYSLQEGNSTITTFWMPNILNFTMSNYVL